MNQIGRYFIVAALSGALATPAILAQSSQSAQNQQSQPAQDQYNGVSHPPPDNTIQADEDSNPAPAPAPKPSAAVPMAAATPAQPVPAAKPAAAAAHAAPAEDPDYGIVTSVPAENADNSAGPGVELKKRAWNPDDDIVSVVPSDPNALNAGTNITVRLLENLSTTETQEGSPFRASVVSDVYKGGSVIIPAGSTLYGRVISVSQGHHIGPHATLRLRPDYISLPDGTAYHLYAQVIQSKADGTRVDDEGGIQASRHYTKDALEYGGGVGAGAVAGAAVAGPVGAGVGSLVGAGLVTTHLLVQPPQQADLPTGSQLVFSLTEPMPLTPTKN